MSRRATTRHHRHSPSLGEKPREPPCFFYCISSPVRFYNVFNITHHTEQRGTRERRAACPSYSVR